MPPSSKLKPVACATFALAFVLISLVSAAVVSGAENDPQVNFRWAFAARTGTGNSTSVEPVTRDCALKTGDQLKIMIEMLRPCYVYVFHYNERDGLKLLFPSSLQQFSTDYRIGRKYYVPRDNAWFELDANPGEEVFYLLASGSRLSELEQAYAACEPAPEADKKLASAKVVDLIRTIRKQNREFTSAAERPVAIGGAVREMQPPAPGTDLSGLDIASMADEIVSSGLVARTFTIEHRQ